MTIAITVSKLLDKYLPSNGINTEQEKLRINLYKEISVLVGTYHKEMSKMKCPFCEKITEHTILNVTCNECK